MPAGEHLFIFLYMNVIVSLRTPWLGAIANSIRSPFWRDETGLPPAGRYPYSAARSQQTHPSATQTWLRRMLPLDHGQGQR